MIIGDAFGVLEVLMIIAGLMTPWLASRIYIVRFPMSEYCTWLQGIGVIVEIVSVLAMIDVLWGLRGRSVWLVMGHRWVLFGVFGDIADCAICACECVCLDNDSADYICVDTRADDWLIVLCRGTSYVMDMRLPLYTTNAPLSHQRADNTNDCNGPPTPTRHWNVHNVNTTTTQSQNPL